MAMAKKKPATRATTKKAIKKTVKKVSGAQIKSPQQKAVKKKPPAMKVAVRVTKNNIKAVKPTSKSASSQSTSPVSTSPVSTSPVSTSPAEPPQTVSAVVPAPLPLQPETQNPIEVPEPASAASRQPQRARPISEDEIRHRAYLRWEAAGRPPGDGGHFWAEAERELMQQS
jgi:hypothetical protein